MGFLGFVGASGSGGGGGTPANPSTSVQYNNAGSFGGDQNLEWKAGVGLQIGSTAGTLTGLIKLVGLTSGVVSLSVLDAAGTWTMKLPNSAGTNGYVLQTDGSGNTSWVAQSGSAGAITIGSTTISGGTTGRVLYDNAGVFGEASNFTISSGNPNVATGGEYLYNGNGIAFAVDPGGGNPINYFLGGAGNLSTTGNANFGEGPGCLASITTGTRNMAMGSNALNAGTSADRNCAMGANTLKALTTGFNNMAIGFSAMVSATTCSDNVVIGQGALGLGTTDSFNVAIGSVTLENQNGGGPNVAIGYGTGADITTGGNNTFIGYNTGRGITTGGSNTIIGASVSGLSASLSSQIILATNGSIKAQFDSTLNGNWNLQGGDGVYTNSTTFMLRSKVALSNGAAANTGTLTNAPSSGNPSKWLPYDDNGTTRYIPAW